jgi:hypothetical protein
MNDDDLSEGLRRIVDQAEPISVGEAATRARALPASRRGRVLLVVGVLTFVALIVGVAMLRSDDRGSQDLDVVGPPSTPATVPTATSVPTTVPSTTAPPATVPVGDPEEFVAVTQDGRLVVVDIASGEEVRELARAGDPSAPPPDEGPGDNVIDSIDVIPGDPAQVLYETCCEPIAGSVFGTALDGGPTTFPVAERYGEEDFLFYGADPAMSAQGIIAVADSGPGAVSTFRPDELFPARTYFDPDGQGRSADPAWVDEDTLVYAVGIDLGIVEAGQAHRIEARGDTDWTHPVGVADGILVVEQCCGDFEDEYETATAVIVDPDSGAIVRSFPFEDVVVDLDVSESGVLLAMFRDGRVMRVDPATGEATELASGYLRASW